MVLRKKKLPIFPSVDFETNFLTGGQTIITTQKNPNIKLSRKTFTGWEEVKGGDPGLQRPALGSGHQQGHPAHPLERETACGLSEVKSEDVVPKIQTGAGEKEGRKRKRGTSLD